MVDSGKVQKPGHVPDRRLQTFQHYFAVECGCHGQRYATQEQVLAQAENGGATCGQCDTRFDLREALGHFSTLGRPEALFGLDVFLVNKEIPASSSHQVMVIDPEVHLPYKGTLVYANVTPQCAVFDEAPSLLAPQTLHQTWSMHMRFHVPPGGARALSILVAVKPTEGLPEPLEIALQAVDAFHRYRLPLAGLLLAAAAEAILRPLSEWAYSQRSVKLPPDLGFASLLERARMLFEPALGAQLVGHLRDLARDARNPSAHGRPSDLTRDDVAKWMVDVAVLYEWARVATCLVAKGGAAV